jgi:microcystin-dependent protein
MPEMPDVIPEEPVSVEWGNDIRDRSLQRYASSAHRNSLNPTPVPGEISYLGDTGVIEVYHSGLWRATVPTGVILPYAGITPPTGYLICDGRSFLRTTHPGLFAVIGTTYGAADATHFNIPDLRQRFPMGMAASGAGDSLGAKGGSINHNHTLAHRHTGPSHIHHMEQDTGMAGAHDHGGQSAGAVKGNYGGHTFDGIADVSSQAEEHRHAIPNQAGHLHAIDKNTDAGGTAQTGPATNVGTDDLTGNANPPFIALHFVIRT